MACPHARRFARCSQQLAVALADTNSLECQQRIVQEAAQLWKHLGDLRARADRDDHHRHVGVSREELGAGPSAATGAIDAEQYGGAGDPPSIEQVADRREGRHAKHPAHEDRRQLSPVDLRHVASYLALDAGGRCAS
jgi:hypothetical protein